MAYATTNPPALMSQSIGNQFPAIWMYSSTDAVTVVRVSGYITNAGAPHAQSLGMKVRDLVYVLDNDASPPTGSLCWVAAISATTGAADLSDGVTITGTNTD